MKTFVSNSDEHPRIFKNNFAEFMSKNHWSAPILVFIPIITYLFVQSINQFKLPIGIAIAFFMLGLAFWTFAEYFLHRFVFHYHPKSEWGKKLHWTFHGVHHDYPQDSLRLVMPPGVSLPLASIFFVLFLQIFQMGDAFAFASGFYLGYLSYDIMHYGVHHFAIKNKWLMAIKKHHMKHHYVDPDLGFGVSSTIWDYIFKTGYPEKKV